MQAFLSSRRVIAITILHTPYMDSSIIASQASTFNIATRAHDGYHPFGLLAEIFFPQDLDESIRALSHYPINGFLRA
ncbi:MAG: hypothetical protein PHG00_14180 [Methylococcales bacterium]|nr:hypothetical protein [Methylococcales bacterium]